MSDFKAGRLRHRIRIEQYVNQLDSNGDAIQDPETGEPAMEWVLVRKVWAAIAPLSAREFIQSSAIQAEVIARITIRHMDGLDASMRIIHNGKVFSIKGLLPDIDSGLEYITIPVSQGVNEAG